MTDAAGAWGGSLERKQSVVSAVSAAIGGNRHAWPSTSLGVGQISEGTPCGNGYCLAFDTVDAAELERRAGLPVDVLLMIGGALAVTVHVGWTGPPTPVHVVPSTEDALVRALEAIRPGADLEALRPLYVAGLLRDLRDLVPPEDGGVAASLPQVIERIAQLHLEAHAGRALEASTWSSVRNDAVAATDAARTELGGHIASFVEAVAWPLEDLVAELPRLVEGLHRSICDHVCKSLWTTDVRTCWDRSQVAFAEIREAQKQAGAVDDDNWFLSRVAENPDCRAANAPEFQARLISFGQAAYDRHGPHAHRLLMDTLKQL